MSAEELQATEERKKIIKLTIAKLAAWIRNRKITEDGSVIKKDAAMGFNLACDFLSHELNKMKEITNEDILED